MHRWKRSYFMVSILGFSTLAGVYAQDAAPPGSDLAAFAKTRFPQPVRVGDLIHRTILQPLESRRVLGHVSQVVKSADGSLKIVFGYGGHLGFFSRLIAVPVDAIALLGVELVIVDFTPAQLDAFPSYVNTDSALAPDVVIHMGLAHPSH